MTNVIYECSICKTALLKGPREVIDHIKDMTKCQKCNNAPIIERK